MGMVVIQPYILVPKLKNQDKVPTLYWLPKLHKKTYKARFFAKSSSCTTLLSTVKRYMKDPVRIYFGLLKIQVKF